MRPGILIIVFLNSVKKWISALTGFSETFQQAPRVLQNQNQKAGKSALRHFSLRNAVRPPGRAKLTH